MKDLRGASAIVAAAFVLAGSAAFGQPGGGPFPHDRGQGITRELGLSQAQQDKVREILDEQRPQRDQLQEKISANRDALHDLLESGSADATAVGELVLQGRKLHEENRALRDAEQKAIRAILTPEQQKKFDRFQSQRRGPGGAGAPGGPGGPGRRGPGPEGWQPGPPQGQQAPPQKQRPPFGSAGAPPLPW
jgi:Spy/CpxP family protein refolding chaperone